MRSRSSPISKQNQQINHPDRAIVVQVSYAVVAVRARAPVTQKDKQIRHADRSIAVEVAWHLWQDWSDSEYLIHLDIFEYRDLSIGPRYIDLFDDGCIGESEVSGQLALNKVVVRGGNGSPLSLSVGADRDETPDTVWRDG